MRIVFLVLALASLNCFAKGFTGLGKVSSNYIWRGITFSENEPSVSFNGNYEAQSGLYGNLFASSLKWAEPTLYEGYSKREVDFSVGYKYYFGDYVLNAFAYRYEFMDQPTISSNEYGAQLAYKNTSLEYYYFPDWFGFKTVSHYLRVSQYLPLDEKFSLVAGLGRNEQSKTKRTQNANGDWGGAGFTSYFDVLAGLQIKDGSLTYELLYTNTDRKVIQYASENPAMDNQKVNAGDQALTVSLIKAI